MVMWLLLMWFLLSVLLTIRFCVLAERCIAAADGSTAAAGLAHLQARQSAPLTSAATPRTMLALVPAA